MTLVGLEVLKRMVSGDQRKESKARDDILCSSRRMSLPMMN